MDERKFKPGDPVMLVSGGPKMSIVKWDNENNAYLCTWMDKNIVYRDSFEESVLMTPPPPGKYRFA